MTQTKPLGVSQHYASSLRAAWDSGDPTTLSYALDQTENAYDARLTGCEREKIELVQSIAATIDVWLRQVRWVGQADLEVSLELLSNLAQPRAARESWPALLPTMSPMAAYQTERLVFVLR
jgi:hypothetical protein